MAHRVLIVDDDPAFRASARAILAAQGFVVVGEAAGAVQARSAAAELAPDAVLLDVHLPDGDGVALVADLTAAPERPRVLLTSSDPSAAPPAVVARSGADGFVAKTALVTTDLGVLLGA
jgi:DNA-binding NarL/FixJ family response regulator